MANSTGVTQKQCSNPPRVAGEAGAQEGIERSGRHEELVQATV